MAQQGYEVRGPNGERGWWDGKKITPLDASGMPGGPPKLTEDQGKSQDFAREMVEAERNYLDARRDGYEPRSVKNALASAVEDFKLPGFGKPFGGLAPLIRDDASDRGVAAQKAWLDARLKAKTGAGQNEQEAVENPKAYFPQFGEDVGVLDPKYRIRSAAYESTRRRAGPAGEALPKEYPNPAKKTGGQVKRSTAPVKVSSVEEAKKLPPGTRFINPQGREFIR